jgi:hypothetical protein
MKLRSRIRRADVNFATEVTLRIDRLWIDSGLPGIDDKPQTSIPVAAMSLTVSATIFTLLDF